MLPALAKVLATPIEALIGDDGAQGAASATPRRTRRGPVSRLEQQLDAIARLPKAKQKIVATFLDAMLAQHGSISGQEVAVTA